MSLLVKTKTEYYDVMGIDVHHRYNTYDLLTEDKKYLLFPDYPNSINLPLQFGQYHLVRLVEKFGSNALISRPLLFLFVGFSYVDDDMFYEYVEPYRGYHRNNELKSFTPFYGRSEDQEVPPVTAKASETGQSVKDLDLQHTMIQFIQVWDTKPNVSDLLKALKNDPYTQFKNT